MGAGASLVSIGLYFIVTMLSLPGTFSLKTYSR